MKDDGLVIKTDNNLGWVSEQTGDPPEMSVGTEVTLYLVQVMAGTWQASQENVKETLENLRV